MIDLKDEAVEYAKKRIITIQLRHRGGIYEVAHQAGQIMALRSCLQCGLSLAQRRAAARYCSDRCRGIAYKVKRSQAVRPCDTAYVDNCKHFSDVYIYNGRFRCVNWKGELCNKRKGVCSWNGPKEGE